MLFIPVRAGKENSLDPGSGDSAGRMNGIGVKWYFLVSLY